MISLIYRVGLNAKGLNQPPFLGPPRTAPECSRAARGPKALTLKSAESEIAQGLTLNSTVIGCALKEITHLTSKSAAHDKKLLYKFVRNNWVFPKNVRSGGRLQCEIKMIRGMFKGLSLSKMDDCGGRDSGQYEVQHGLCSLGSALQPTPLVQSL